MEKRKLKIRRENNGLFSLGSIHFGRIIIIELFLNRVLLIKNRATFK